MTIITFICLLEMSSKLESVVKVLEGKVLPEDKYRMDPIRRARHEDEDVRWQLPRLGHQAKDEGQHDDVDPGKN